MPVEWVGPRDSVARAMARTSHALVEMPSRAAAFSAAAFTDSGSLRLIRAERSSPNDPDSEGVSSTKTSSGSCPARRTSTWPGGELGRNLERRLRQQVEDPESEAGAEDVAEPLGDLCRPFVSEVGDRLQVVAEAVDHECQIHDDITMTSQSMSVKCC